VKSLVKASAVAMLAASLAAPALAHGHHKTPAGPPLTTVVAGQVNGSQVVVGDDRNSAQIAGYAFASSSGNVGANVAGGNANQQSNELFVDNGTTITDLDSGSGQLNGFNYVGWSGDQGASIYGNAFDSSSGNIGANVAAGNLNQQSNVADILTTDDLVALTAGNGQATGLASYWNDGHNSAAEYDHAFDGASGNIGSNIAAGNANQQANLLVVSDGTK